MQTRRQILLSALGPLSARAATPPNVLLIMTDQLTGAALSCAGNRFLRTPNLDSLANQGTRFSNAWCISPVCSPARASLVTGCAPPATGVRYNGDPLNPAIPTLGQIFRKAGYETAWAGKWHLPEGLLKEDRYGFAFQPCDLPSFPRAAAFGDLSDPAVTAAAVAFLRRKHAQPFLLGVSLLNPHDICGWVSNHLPDNHPARHETPPPLAELPPLPANFARDPHEPEFITRCRARDHYGQENIFTKSWDTAQWRRYLWTYYRMVERVDGCIGQVLNALREANFDANTIVVFTADHGEGTAAHHWVVKLMLWQETLTVPLIFRWPNRIAPRVDRQTLLSTMDVTPTLCDLAAVPQPAKQHGKSVAPLLVGRAPAPRTALFAELAPDTEDHSLQGRAARTQHYKYVVFSSGANPEMLFDLQSDPGETRNLASSPSHASELQRHRELLAQYVHETGDTWPR